MFNTYVSFSEGQRACFFITHESHEDMHILILTKQGDKGSIFGIYGCLIVFLNMFQRSSGGVAAAVLVLV